MEEKKINSIYKLYNSLVTLLHNILLGEKISKEEIFYSLFGIIVLDLIINKETMVKNTEGIKYESLMSDNQLEEILKYLNIENIDKDNNGASIYATIRNKLAHGDYYIEQDKLVFNINGKECSVNLKHFVYYYIRLTEKLECRFKDSKFVKHSLVNKSSGKFDKIIETDKEIDEYLKQLTYKEFIFRRLDNKELTTEEKEIFTRTIYKLYGNKENDAKYCDKLLSNVFNDNVYCLNINNHKIYKMKEKFSKEIKMIIDRYNNIYDYDKEFLDNILFQSAEDIYKLYTLDYDHISLKYGLNNLKVILNDMIVKGIYDLDDYIDYKLKIDPFFNVGLPLNEIINSIVITLIYFNYCYPLEKIYKSNKTFTSNDNDFMFNNLNLSELNPEINKLYEIGINNLIKISNDKKSPLEKSLKKCLEDIPKLESQRNNLENYYKNETDEDKKEEYKNKLMDIDAKLNCLKFKYKDDYNLFMEEDNNIKKLSSMYDNIDLNFYNYSILNGIRNSIAHGNVKIKNICTTNLDGNEIEFTDIHENEIKFKLNIKLYNLFALIEEENLNATNDFLVKKKSKRIS